MAKIDKVINSLAIECVCPNNLSPQTPTEKSMVRLFNEFGLKLVDKLKNEKPTATGSLTEAAEKLLKFIDENNVFDSSCDDGDGYTEEWTSKEFNARIEDVEKALKERS